MLKRLELRRPETDSNPHRHDSAAADRERRLNTTIFSLACRGRGQPRPPERAINTPEPTRSRPAVASILLDQKVAVGRSGRMRRT